MEVTPVFAGVDWSWNHHAVCVLDDHGERLEELTVAHSRPGLGRIAAVFTRLGVTRVGIERADGPVVEHLLRHGFEVVVISGPAGRVVAGPLRHGRQQGRPVRRVRAGRCTAHRLRPADPVAPDTAQTVALRMLVRTRQDLVGHRIAVHNQLLAVLQYNFPGAIGLFSQLDIPIQPLQAACRFRRRSKALAVAALRRSAAWPHQPATTCRLGTAQELVEHLTDAAEGCRRPEVLGRPGQASGSCSPWSGLLHRAPPPGSASSRPASAKRCWPTPTDRSSPHCPEPAPSGPPPCSPRSATAAPGSPTTPLWPRPAGVASDRQSGKYLERQLPARLQQAAPFGADRLGPRHPPRQRLGRAHLPPSPRPGCRHPQAARILARAWTRVLWRCWNYDTP